MIMEVDADLVAAASDGDRVAVEQLIVTYMPLVYNIVGRGLGRSRDVDDTVQETMLHVVRGLPDLRNPAAFRSWLVAITMNQVRKQHRQQLPELRPLEAFDGMEDPGSDFADLTIWQLGLTGQRMETAKAVAWLDDDDRELLSLWWLVEAGQLTRGEMITALGLSPHTVTMRVARMKSQLQSARGIVRALNSAPPCPELTTAATSWSGNPSRLWRKRLARHIRECEHCLGSSADLIPAERLLAGLALVPVPLAVTKLVSAGLRGQAGPPTSHRARPHISQHRSITARAWPWTSKLVVGAVGTVAVVSGAVAIAATGSSSGQVRSLSVADPARARVVPATPGSSASNPATKTSPDASPSAVATQSLNPTTPTRSAPSKPKPTPHSSSRSTTPPTTSTPSQPVSSPVPSAAPPSSASAEDQVLAVINKARADQGVPPLTRISGLNASSAAHNHVMLSGCGLNHICPGEPDPGARETAAGVAWSVVGENIGDGGAALGSASSIADMAVGLTNSMLAEKPPNDGHRQNILSTDFHHIGISVIQDSSGKVWLTQDFSD